MRNLGLKNFSPQEFKFNFFFFFTEGEPGILLVLAEEELVAIDLGHEDMKMILLPYLASLHASAVTCSYHASNVPAKLFESLKEAGLRQIQDVYSERVS